MERQTVSAHKRKHIDLYASLFSGRIPLDKLSYLELYNKVVILFNERAVVQQTHEVFDSTPIEWL